MADAVLQRRVEFGRAHALLVREEHRVVAETAAAARREQHAAFPHAFGDQRLRVVGVAQQREHADEARGAAFVRHVAQRIQQFGDIRGVVAVTARVARAVQTRRAVQRIDAQTGIVGQRRQAGGARGVTRLEDRVLDERQSSFLGILDAEFGLRVQIDTGIAEQIAQFRELSRIAAGQHQFHGASANDASSKDASSSRSQRLPYMSSNTATMP